MPQIVYVLSNSAMPGLVKIGYTAEQDVETRIAQLYTTGVPVPFEIEYAHQVPNALELEKALHLAFAPYRVHSRREFFKIAPEQATAILRIFPGEDVTPELTETENEAIDEESKAAGARMRSRRPNLNFEEMGIPIESTLQFTDGSNTVKVLSSRRVKLGETEVSLTAATRTILNLPYNVAPAIYWTYKGENLREIYDRTYEPID